MRMLSRRCLLLGALIAPWAAHAQNWPAGNIKIVVPYPPGGSIDMLMPDNKRLRSKPLGIAFYDASSGKSLLIAELKDSIDPARQAAKAKEE